MAFLMKSLISLPVFYFLAGHNFHCLWKGGLIGVGIMLAADTAGHYLNLYHYRNSQFMIGGFMPLPHIFNMFLISMLYLNWLPRQWPERISYTAYMSALFIVIEVIMKRAGAIEYLNWELWYSYLLIFVGLSVLAYLSDFVQSNMSFYNQ